MSTVTVAICTWNRARLLASTLAAMRKLRVPVGIEWELLIVNNNCTDDTDEVIARHSNALPIRRLFELEQGLSNARNCAIRAAKGEVIIWTDDDVLVDADWLAAYSRAIERWPDAVYFGGLINPWYETPPPTYITANLSHFQGLLLIRDFGQTERPFADGEVPFGANMAFKRALFDRWHFDPGLGRKGNETMLGEETELVERLQKDQLQGVWIPTAKVRHFVPVTRTKPKFIWNYGVGYGRTLMRTRGVSEGKALWGAPRWLYRTHWTLRCKALWQRGTRQPRWAATYYDAAKLHGIIIEARAKARNDRSSLMV